MKWYQPLRQREATAATGQAELGLNEGLQKNAANLTAYGAPGNNVLAETLNRMYPGAGFGDVTANSQLDLQRTALQGSGQGPSAYDPLFSSVGHYGAVKKENLSPEEYQQAMTLRYGPGWQNPNGAPGAAQPQPFNPYEQATGHIFGSPEATGGATGAAPAAGTGGVSYGIPSKPMPGMGAPAPQPQQQAQPKGNPDEYGNGGIFAPANPRVASPTGGF